MKIILILAADSNDPLVGSDPIMPLSLPLLAGAAPDHDYTFFDMLKKENPPGNPDCNLVGISYRANSEKTAFHLADKYRSSGIKVILGGPQASADPEMAKEHSDAVAVGEAEETWPVILEDAGNDSLKSFYVSEICTFKVNSVDVYRPDSSGSKLPDVQPRRELFRKNYVFDTVYAMRGCHVGCDFCFVPGMYGVRYRTRPVNEVVEEISRFKRYYYLLDDSVFGRASTYEYYLELFDSISRLPHIRFWTGQANLDAASSPEGRKVIQAAAKSGMLYAAVGMESIDPVVLRKNGAMNKMGVTGDSDPLDTMIQNIRFIQDCGIIISGWFTIGYEEDSLETIDKTWEFCKKYGIIPVIFLVKPLKGTPLYKRLEKEGRLKEVLETGVLTGNFTSSEAMKSFETIYAKAFRFRERIRRISYHRKAWKTDPVGVRIHKLMFLWFLQKNLGRAMKSFPRYFIENRLSGE